MFMPPPLGTRHPRSSTSAHLHQSARTASQRLEPAGPANTVAPLRQHGVVVVVVPVLVAVAFGLIHAADCFDLVPAHIARAARSALVVSLLVLMLTSWDAYSDLVTSFFRWRLGSP